ncbi:T-complex protein 11-domain-containing protein [Phycomyces nitens]|nr:T-complex protein 11-domain-containing protein [Phycomyces nitens]
MEPIQPILTASKELLHKLEEWFDSQPPHVQGIARMALEECWNSYYALSESIKTQDVKQQKENVAALYLDIARLKATLGLEGPEAAQQQQQVLRSWMESREPETIPHLTQAEQVLQTLPTQSSHPPIPPSPTPRPERLALQETPDNEDTIHVSPEQLSRLLTGYAPASGRSHEQIAHEIIMDPEFRLYKREPDTDLESRIRTIATKAFFDRVAEELDQGHPEKSIPSLMNDIRTRLVSLVNENSPWIERINEAIDIELIEQETKKGAFDLEKTLNMIIDFMLEMCAPARDQAIQAIRSLSRPVDKIKAILETLEDMVFDLMNFRLRALRPALVPMAVSYERARFAEALSHGQAGLAKTRSWLQKAYRRVREANQQRTETAKKLPNPSKDAVFEEAFVSLLTSTEPLIRITCPETLLLDVDRLANYQQQVHHITTVAALLMLARSFGGTGDLTKLTNTLSVMLEDSTTASIDNLTVEIEQHINTSSVAHSMVRSMVEKTLSHNDMVYTLLARRVGSVLRNHLHTGHLVEQDTLISSGLGYVRQPLKDLSQRLYVLVHHNRQVYQPWYDAILQDEQQGIHVNPTPQG